MKRASDGRTAALAAAALAASWLAVRVPTRFPVLEPGLGGPASPRPPGPRVEPVAPEGPEETQTETRAQSPEDQAEPAADEPLLDAPADARAPSSPSPSAFRAAPSSPGSVAASALATRPESRAARSNPGGTAVPETKGAPPASRAAETRAVPRPPARRIAAPSGTLAARPGAPAPRARHDSPPIAAREARREAAARQARTSFFASRSGSARGGGGGRSAGPRSSLFGGPVRGGRAGGTASRRRASATKRFRPLLLSKLIGPRPLKPPPAGLKAPPALAGLDALRPALDPHGAPVPRTSAPLSSLEETDPAKLGRDRRAAAHWDADQWHAGAARGVIRDGAWAWLYHEGSRWWAVAGDGSAPLLRHDGVWWTRRGETWFVLHDGQPWAQRPFHDWDARGLVQPGSGTEMVYSKDYKRVAVISPGNGAEVFDAVSGALLDRIEEGEMPSRRRPKAPASLPRPGD